jgi:hypothetical protein
VFRLVASIARKFHTDVKSEIGNPKSKIANGE